MSRPLQDAPQNQLIQAVMDVNDGICFVKNNDFIYEYINDAFSRAFQISADDVIGKDDFEIFPSEIANTLRENDKRILTTKEAESVEECGVINGKMEHFRTNKSVLTDDKGEVFALCGIAISITYEKELEERQKQLIQKLKTANNIKDKVFSVIGHDLRAPFSALISGSKILCDESSELSEEFKNSLTKSIHSTSSSALLLLENLMIWSKNKIDKEPIKKVNIDINKMLNDCIATFKLSTTSKKLILKHAVNENSFVYADQSSLQIVMTNLINNAIKFTPENGTITITLDDTPEQSTLCIKDNGIGISAENIHKIFDHEQYFTTYGTSSEKGTGLGLGLCHELIIDNGGKIWVESTEGVGSCFFVAMPHATANLE